MATLIVEHEVENYENWKSTYEGHANVRDAHGVTNSRVYRSADNPQLVHVTMEGAPDGLMAFANDPTLKEAMGKAGVIGKPSFTFLGTLTP